MANDQIIQVNAIGSSTKYSRRSRAGSLTDKRLYLLLVFVLSHYHIVKFEDYIILSILPNSRNCVRTMNWIGCLLVLFTLRVSLEYNVLSRVRFRVDDILDIKRFTTSARPFGIGVIKGKLTRQFGFFPIHGGSNDTKECHGFDEYFEAMGIHFGILFWFFKRIIQGIGKTVAPTSPYT
jgi:hypothetical protein